MRNDFASRGHLGPQPMTILDPTTGKTVTIIVAGSVVTVEGVAGSAALPGAPRSPELAPR